MEKKDFDTKFDELILEALKTRDKPAVRLNNELKAEIYERERFRRQGTAGRSISLWYLPMILILLYFSCWGQSLSF